ncbi:hypothetical protein P691DRAFT_508254 [Macrolepiota fuliginosa MF-IS2]|uniref:MARVEL domain-containing protein n=1 Tax=Macrolepiota fuliginosa MF-IS2 TaxID=1400762 RepID=A0A9P5XGM0_9AGAR|nr:hypothetical protein P691DRAFT_508254 [Macrolepiota fuliginosa MF-IS2]
MGVDSVVRRSYPIFFAFVFCFSVITLAISGWLVARFNSHHNYRSKGERDRVRYFLFVSSWTVLLLPFLMTLFMIARNSIGASVLSHVVFLFVTWVFWLTASAALTEALGGGLNCSTNTLFRYCGQLNALVAFGWINWVFLSFALFVALLLGIRTIKRGDGYGGSLVASPT